MSDRVKIVTMATTMMPMRAAMIARMRVAVTDSNVTIFRQGKTVLRPAMMAMKTTVMAALVIAKLRAAAMGMSSAVKRLVMTVIKSKPMGV